MISNYSIKVLVHIIDGLPYETKEDMLDIIKYLNKFNIWGIKIHMLNVVKGTELANLYEKEHFHILTLPEYVDIIIDQLELLREDIVVNRLTADAKKEDLIEPEWIIRKFVVLDEIDKEMARRDTYQGIKYQK